MVNSFPYINDSKNSKSVLQQGIVIFLIAVFFDIIG